MESTSLFIVSFIVTWSLGLLPAIIIRYALKKGPVNRVSAFILSVVASLVVFSVFWYLNYIAGESESYGNRSHGVLFLIGYVSYLILRRGAKPRNPDHEALAIPDTQSPMKDDAVIECNQKNGTYYVWTSKYFVQYMKSFSSLEEAEKFVENNPEKCVRLKSK